MSQDLHLGLNISMISSRFLPLSGGHVRVDVDISFLLDMQLLMANVARELLIVLNSTLADSHFFGHNRLLFNPRSLLSEWNADVLVAANLTIRALSSCRSALNYYLLA